jgi:2-iminoacetate synthase ThiH
VAAMEKAIREAGRVPAQRDTWYRRLNTAAASGAPDEGDAA